MRRVPQVAGVRVRDYLVIFSEAAAECTTLAEEENNEETSRNPCPETGGLPGVGRPRNRKEAIAEAVRIQWDQGRRNRGRREMRDEPPSGVRGDGRRPR